MSKKEGIEVGSKWKWTGKNEGSCGFPDITITEIDNEDEAGFPIYCANIDSYYSKDYILKNYTEVYKKHKEGEMRWL